jgi:hypothetical protein
LELHQCLRLDRAQAQAQALVFPLQLLNALLLLIDSGRQGLWGRDRSPMQTTVALQVTSEVISSPFGQMRGIQSVLTEQGSDVTRLRAGGRLLDDRPLELDGEATPLGLGLDLRRPDKGF